MVPPIATVEPIALNLTKKLKSNWNNVKEDLHSFLNDNKISFFFCHMDSLEDNSLHLIFGDLHEFCL